MGDKIRVSFYTKSLMGSKLNEYINLRKSSECFVGGNLINVGQCRVNIIPLSQLNMIRQPRG